MPIENASAFAVDTHSYSRSMTAEAAVEILAEKGYGEVEFFVVPGHLSPSEASAQRRSGLRAAAGRAGIGIRSLCIPGADFNFASPYPEVRDFSIAMFESLIDLACDLGASSLVIPPGRAFALFPLPQDQLVGHFYRALDALLTRGDARGVAILVENVPSSFLKRMDDLVDALDRYGRPDLGINYDVANGHYIGEDVPAALRRAGPRLSMLHISDTTRQSHLHARVGAGTVDFAAIGTTLAALGYHARPVLELVEPDGIEGIDISVARLTALGWRDYAAHGA